MLANMEPTPAIIRLLLPWPSRTLHPNARPCRAVKTKATRAARAAAAQAMAAAMAAHGIAERGWRQPEGKSSRLRLVVTFMPPSGRWRDDDGMIAAFKASRDGIADAMGVDDRWFEPVYQVGMVKAGGAVGVDVPWNAVERVPESSREGEAGKVAPDWLRAV